MSKFELLDHPFVDVVATALLHFLWQGTVILLSLLLLAWLFALRRPAARYRLHLCALIALLACPAATISIVAGPQPSPSAVDSAASGEVEFRSDVPVVEFGASDALGLSGSDSVPDAVGGTSQWQQGARSAGLLCWLVGVLLLSLRLLAGWCGTRWLMDKSQPAASELTDRVRELATSLQIRKTVRTQICNRVREAMVIGLFRPVILLPAAWLTTLPPEVLEAILLHELAHVRRRDLWVNALQRLAETLLFYHPAVWWISKQLHIEREKCCDQMAVTITGDACSYARSLECVARQYIEPRPPLLALPFGGQKMELLARVNSVLGTERPRPLAGFSLSLVLMSMAASAAFFMPAVLADDPEMPHVKKQAAAAVGLADPERENQREHAAEVALAELQAENERLRRLVRQFHPDPNRFDVEDALSRPVHGTFHDVPLRKVLENLTADLGVPLEIDAKALRIEGVSETQRVSISVRGIMLKSALNLLLEPLGLNHDVHRGQIRVTSRRANELILMNYAVEDLLPPPMFVNVGDGVGIPVLKKSKDTRLETFGKLIASLVAPDTWDEAGGPGAVMPFEDTQSLVIRQTQAVHAEIQKLLEELRQSRSEFIREIESQYKDPDLQDELQRIQAEVKAAEAVLDRQVSMHFEGEALPEVTARLGGLVGVNVLLDPKGLCQAGVSPEQPVTLHVVGVPLREALRQLLTPLKLRYNFRDSVITITNRPSRDSKSELRNYQVGDLIVQSVSGHKGFDTSLDRLAQVLRQAVEPESWRDFGGPATIKPFASTGSLVIRQAQHEHQLVEDFLKAVRRQQESKDNAIAGQPVARVCIVGKEGQVRPTHRQSIALLKIMTKPGEKLSLEQLDKDINTMYRTGWFLDVEARAFSTSAGVIVVFEVKDRTE